MEEEYDFHSDELKCKMKRHFVFQLFSIKINNIYIKKKCHGISCRVSKQMNGHEDTLGLFVFHTPLFELTCCSKSMVLMAWRQGRIIIGNPTATDIMKPTRIISVTRLEGKFISTLPAMFSVKLT